MNGKKNTIAMIKDDRNGRYVLQYEVEGVIRRLPLERRGVSKAGREWTMGQVLLEVSEEGVDGSAQLHLITWSEEMVEMLNRIGVGKRVKSTFHVECKEYFDNYKTSLILDGIEMLSDGENYLIGKKKGENK